MVRMLTLMKLLQWLLGVLVAVRAAVVAIELSVALIRIQVVQ